SSALPRNLTPPASPPVDPWLTPPHTPPARGGHVEATYALVRPVRGILSLSPGRKVGDLSHDRNVSVVFRKFPGVCHEAGGRHGVAGAFHRRDLPELSVRPRRARAQERDDSCPPGRGLWRS